MLSPSQTDATCWMHYHQTFVVFKCDHLATSLNTLQHHPTMSDDVATIWLDLQLPLFPISSITSGGIILKYKP